MYVIPENEYIEHYGVMGMKWGHHKSQEKQLQKEHGKNEDKKKNKKQSTYKKVMRKLGGTKFARDAIIRSNLSTINKEKALREWEILSGKNIKKQQTSKSKSFNSKHTADKASSSIDKFFKDNPKATYNTIYKSKIGKEVTDEYMHKYGDTSFKEDPDYYREIEKRYLKSKGYQ